MRYYISLKLLQRGNIGNPYLEIKVEYKNFFKSYYGNESGFDHLTLKCQIYLSFNGVIIYCTYHYLHLSDIKYYCCYYVRQINNRIIVHLYIFTYNCKWNTINLRTMEVQRLIKILMRFNVNNCPSFYGAFIFFLNLQRVVQLFFPDQKIIFISLMDLWKIDSPEYLA